jgi:dinuclear metal center YbgI/SA1388 family protein
VLADTMNSLLRVDQTPDYAPALNGVQVDHRGPVTKIAAAVDCSARTIGATAAAGANLLIVHHGLFWSGLQPITGPFRARLRLLFDHDIAVYSAHLPLDAHERFGNSRLLASELGLVPTAGFATYQTIQCGVLGDADLATSSVLDSLRVFARSHGGDAIASPHASTRRTHRWAICSGAGATADTIKEAVALGVDTIITGEGPHWSAVEAEEKGLVIIYAGHYATETLGVRALAEHIATQYELPWTFLHAPTGL